MSRWRSIASNRFAAATFALLATSMAGSTGCEVISKPDRSQIGEGGSGGAGEGGTAGMGSSSTGTAGMGGMAGAGGGMAGAGGMAGMGGAGGMSGCMQPSDCPGMDTVCQTRTCDANTCGMTYAPQGTPWDMQTAGDCQLQVCDGAGTVANQNDDTDPKDDGNDCTMDQCNAGQPENVPLIAGTACASNGGKVCDGNGACVECVSASDCVSNVCTQNICVAASCADTTKNGSETDVDCGGADCAPCADGLICVVSTDCQSGVCDAGICAAATCVDGVKNGDETDKDCGGTICNPCGPDLGCKVDADCVGGQCSGSLCLPTCTDQTKNSNETDVDCGGPTCSACNDGQTCGVGSDCTSGVCTAGVCQAPTCSDNTKNGAETGTDCGGPCGPCADGGGCNLASECQSGVCTMNVCQAPTCSDNTQNGAETGTDCGGGTCPGCALGGPCNVNGDCASNICVGGVCVVSLCGDALITGAEVCDDGNTMGGDGCDATCVVESGWSCMGAPSACTTTCGDSILAGMEACDDGNTNVGDGCGASCAVETGYSCSGQPSVCVSICGDGLKLGGEACDDGNKNSGDGCDASCIVEPGFTCTGNMPSACTTTCGDGIKAGMEACDDANASAGDGCSATCTVESGYACSGSPSVCGPVCGDGMKIGAEACDDSNKNSGDCCSSACALESGCEIEPNDTDATANAWTAVAIGNKVKAFNNPTLDKDVFKIDVPANAIGTLTAEVVDGPLGTTCASNNIDSFLTIRNSAGTSLGTDDDTGAGWCSLLTVSNLAPGSYYVEQKRTTNGPLGFATYDYSLQLTLALSICGDGVKGSLEGCDDGNTVSGDGCSATCKLEPEELEPNGTCALANGPAPLTAVNVPRLVSGSISPAGDLDWFSFTVPNYADVRLETFDINGPSTCASIDTVIQAFKSDCVTALGASKDGGGVSNCSKIDPSTDAYIRHLAPGQYNVQVKLFNAANIGNYTLQATMLSLCGNGVVEGSEQCDGGPTCAADCTFAAICGDGTQQASEQCEDGNTVSGDGCSATCTWETTAEIEPNETVADADTNAVSNPQLLIDGNRNITGAMPATTDKDIFKVSVTAQTVLRFELFDSSGRDCVGITATNMRLLDSAGVSLKTDTVTSGIGSCPALVVPVAPGTYYVQLDKTSGTLASYFLQARFEQDKGTETEANETIAAANPFNGFDSFIYGDHQVDADVDVYAITVPAGASVRAETIEGDTVETCESNGIDSLLTLYNAAGTSLVSNDDAGRGFCSLIDGTGSVPLNAGAHGLAAGTYYLEVKKSSAASAAGAIFNYRLAVTIRNP